MRRNSDRYVAEWAAFCLIASGLTGWSQALSSIIRNPNEPVPIMARENSTEMRYARIERPALPSELRSGVISVASLRKPLSAADVKLLIMAEKQIAQNQDAEAAKTLSQAMQIESVRPHAQAILGTAHLTAYLLQKDAQLLIDATEELESAVAALPDGVMVQANVGLAHFLGGDVDRALREARRALQMDPARAQTRYLLAEILRWRGNTAEAIFHLKKVAHLLPAAAQTLQSLTGQPSARSSN